MSIFGTDMSALTTAVTTDARVFDVVFTDVSVPSVLMDVSGKDVRFEVN